MPPGLNLVSALLLSSGLLGAPVAALGQGMHPAPLGPRPLQLRLSEADSVALATVDEVRSDRIALSDVRTIRGELPPSFEVKRSPANPPPLAAGVEVVLLLRGARSPYVLVDEPRELIVLGGPSEALVWEEALARLLSRGSDRERLRSLYLGWLDGDAASLRDVAASALVDPRSRLAPLPSVDARERARVALDPHASSVTRRTSALLAAGDPEARAQLLRGLPGPAVDPQVVEVALRAGGPVDRDALGGAIDRCLAHPQWEVRRAGVRGSLAVWSGAIEARLETLKDEDPDGRVKREAEKALKRGRRGTGG